jgi:excisionase family DNA binding protein
MAKRYKRYKRLRPFEQTRFAYSVKKAGLLLGVGETSIYHLISTGALWTIMIGDRRLVPHSAIEGFIESFADTGR